MQGGALLGQGVFGCIFDPAPPCAGGHVFKTIAGQRAVGKLTSDEDGVDDELGIGKAIMALPLAAQYFALPTASCKAGDPAADPEAKGCRVLNDAGEGTTFSLLIMPVAGKQLIKWALDLQRVAVNYERLFRHLLEGMIIYQGAGFIHNDIHMGNVLVDDRDVARYIDFGLAFNLKNIRTWSDTNMGKKFRPKYVWHAPEIHVWRMLRNKISVTEGFKQLTAINEEYELLESQYSNRMRLEAVLNSLAQSNIKDGGKFIHKYAKKFDCWRIGLCMWHLWQDILLVPKNIDSEKIRRVLGGLTDFDPRTRLSAEEALYILDARSRFSQAAHDRRVPKAPTQTVLT